MEQLLPQVVEALQRLHGALSDAVQTLALVNQLVSCHTMLRRCASRCVV